MGEVSQCRVLPKCRNEGTSDREQRGGEERARRGLTELREAHGARSVHAALALRGTAETRHVWVHPRPVCVVAYIAATARVAFVQTKSHADLSALRRILILRCNCGTTCYAA